LSFSTQLVDDGPSFIVRKSAAVGGLPTFANPVILKVGYEVRTLTQARDDGKN
jgi:hypothetical protein